jgi:hypothetical protein
VGWRSKFSTAADGVNWCELKKMDKTWIFVSGAVTAR